MLLVSFRSYVTMSFMQADCSLVYSPSRLPLNLLLIKKTCYYKKVPMLLCLSCKQPVHTSFRYYKNDPLLPCLSYKQLVHTSFRYYKNDPLLLCLSCKQTVHTSFRYYKNVPLLLCLSYKQPVPLSRIGRLTCLLNPLIHINFCSFSNIIFVSLLQNVYLCNHTKVVTHIKSGDLL